MHNTCPGAALARHPAPLASAALRADAVLELKQSYPLNLVKAPHNTKYILEFS